MSLETFQALGQLGRDLDAAVRAMEDLERTSATADTTYKLARAKAYLDADGSIQAREAVATVATSELYEKAEVASAAVRVQREHIRALHARIDIGRSIFAAERQMAGSS